MTSTRPKSFTGVYRIQNVRKELKKGKGEDGGETKRAVLRLIPCRTPEPEPDAVPVSVPVPVPVPAPEPENWCWSEGSAGVRGR